jgi:carotenoid 1,2-hydratase
MAADQNTSIGNFQFSSSIAEDVSHPSENPAAYEWWYFDAINDDGRDVLVLTFQDNFVFSPRYNSHCQKNGGGTAGKVSFPALEFSYYRDGKALFRTACEYPASSFSADGAIPSCKIGNNSFQFESAPYGEGYSVRIDAEMKDGRRIKANLEWLMVEGNLLPGVETAAGSHKWNLVSPRCDVTGKTEIYGKAGKLKETLQFRGTGYHDHQNDDRWPPSTLHQWHWGRAHFADVTAVFYHYFEMGAEQPVIKMLLSSVNGLEEKPAYCEEKNFGRNLLGLKYPRRLTFYRRDNVRLRLKQLQIIDSSTFYLRFLSEAVLTVGDGKPRKTIAVTEFFDPKALKYRWLDWLTDRRIKRISSFSASASDAE